MIERKGDDSARAALSDAGPRQVDRVKVGQEVKAGEPLCMVEAMKMENVLLAERNVTVKKRSRQTRQFAGGRCGDHGIRVSDFESQIREWPGGKSFSRPNSSKPSRL